jgi:hypothetical protein
MSKFCENPLCRWHIECDRTCNRLAYLTTARPTSYFADRDVTPSDALANLEVRRIVIKDSATGRLLRLCEICGNAVAIANDQQKNDEHESQRRTNPEPAPDAPATPRDSTQGG